MNIKKQYGARIRPTASGLYGCFMGWDGFSAIRNAIVRERRLLPEA